MPLSWKAKVEAQYAQLVEAVVLAIAIGWITWLMRSEGSRLEDESHVLLVQQTAPYLLVFLHLLGLSAVIVAIVRHGQVLPKALQSVSRRERDAGVVVGCILPPTVLLSRLVAEIYQNQSFSAFTFFYAWNSISIGISTLVKICLFRSTSLSISILVDVVLLPFIFYVGEIEADSRFVLATVCRCFVSLMLSCGLRFLPRSFTLGEALLVSQGIGMCAFDLVLSVVDRLNEHEIIDFPPHITHSWLLFTVERSDHVLALQVGMLGSLLVCLAVSPVLRAHGASTPTTIAPTLPVGACISFIARLLASVIFVVYPWSCFLLNTWNPFEWLFLFILDQQSRGVLIVYWLTCLFILIPVFAWFVNRFDVRHIIARKLFHLLAVIMFVPACYLDAAMLSLSYGVALSVFVLVECIRATAFPPFGKQIAMFMKSFIDHREAGRVILTHSYLLLGCALPLWFSHSTTSSYSVLIANAGVLALGVGDAMGAAIGSTFGKHKLFGGKTWEGSIAMAVFMLLASLALHNFHIGSIYNADHDQVLLLTGAIILTTVLEAATSQIDNLILPLFFYSVCNLVSCHGD